jgi:transposase
VIRDAKARRVSRNAGEVFVPKCGWVRFRWSRSLPVGKLGQARVTADPAGRWHVSFPAPQPAVSRAPTGTGVGIDRGVATALVTSGGQHYRAPRISDRDAKRYLALQRRHARQAKGSKKREKTRLAMARITAKVTDRRRDWAEKISTRLVRECDLIAFEKLNTPGMTRKPTPKPDPQQPGAFLPNRARAKAGLNKAILTSAWGVLTDRTQQKAEAPPSCTSTLASPRSSAARAATQQRTTAIAKRSSPARSAATVDLYRRAAADQRGNARLANSRWLAGERSRISAAGRSIADSRETV